MGEFMADLGVTDPAGKPLRTKVWGYDGSSPGPTIEAVRGAATTVRWVNALPTTHLFESAIDHSLDGANGKPSVRTVVHLHGAAVASASDGEPEAWFTPGNSATYTYPNVQEAATLWYHDHAMGITRLNVTAGLAGFYLLRDPAAEQGLPSGKYEVPLVLQDRTFNADGSLFFPTAGTNPAIHPQWVPETFGNVILVNGKAWPNLNVEPRRYRLRFLDGSDARFYEMSFSGPRGQPAPVMYQIGSDGGLLNAPVALAQLFLAPGERADVVVDFTGLAPGAKFTLTNEAKAPFPRGTVPDPQTAGQVMQFTVVAATGPDTSVLPAKLRATPIGSLQPGPGAPPAKVRTLTLFEQQGPAGPQAVLLDGKHYADPVTENPKLGSTEIWEIVNTTADAHPIHLHLVQYQLVSRQAFQAGKYLKDYTAAQPVPSPSAKAIPVAPYLQGSPRPPPPEEAGWKDTIKMFPGEVTRIIARFGPFLDASGAPAFDPTVGHYVWHCHILEHEDNDMMRPYAVMP
jgi:FtsP/CotA-like multicopper oxidase with cupredoxin domain